MPDLLHSLQGRDLGHLRIIASLWGIELNAPDAHIALPLLVKSMLDRRQMAEIVEALPAEAQAAMHFLLANEGHVSWSNFVRRFGSLREIGPGRRDRERPYLTPISPAEILWYRGLIGRAFLKDPDQTEAQEFAFIPDEFLPWLPALQSGQPEPPGRQASPLECAVPYLATDHILDHACTLLAALRLGLVVDSLPVLDWGIPTGLFVKLLACADMLDAARMPQPEPTRAFLESRRGEALVMLVRGWIQSPSFNDLWLMPGILCEGEWRNDPLDTRQKLLTLLGQVPPQTWWNLSSFVSGVHECEPDFQRPAGDYDSWLIRRVGDGDSLIGNRYWDEVDGALVRFIITGPLHWLGITDLATSRPDAAPLAFRFSAWAPQLLKGEMPIGLAREDSLFQVTTEGRLTVPSSTSRAVRYQVARFCQWEAESPNDYVYRITPSSLERARNQGLRTGHLISLMRRYASAPPTPALVQSLEHWEESGTQATLEPVVLLRVKSPEMLSALRRTPAARFLGDPLNPTTTLVKEGAVEKVIKALAGLGYLADARLDVFNRLDQSSNRRSNVDETGLDR